MTMIVQVILFMLVISRYLGKEQLYREAQVSVLYNRILLGHIISTFKTRGVLSCAHKCLAYPLCKSYNYHAIPGEHGICQLNNNEGNVEENFDSQPGCLFGRMAEIRHPRSCIDLLRTGAKTSGLYDIRDSSNNHLRVFCDMTSEPGWAWTLVMSQSFHNRRIKQLTAVPLYEDGSLNASNPNWDAYRLPLRQMQELKALSCHWRITCNFPTKVFEYRDYVKGNFSQFNILNFKGIYICKIVDYINIKSYNCSQCTVSWWQEAGSLLHHDLSLGRCFFESFANKISVWDADYFGYYAHRDKSFSCSREDSSNTNHWFGAHI